MKDELIKLLSRKQLEKVCKVLNEHNEGSRVDLQARISLHSYKEIKQALSSL